MVNFILQEAHEKANEIRVKTEHDFNVEKQTLIHAARQRLNEEYAQKEREREVQQRIAKSTAVGDARVKKNETERRAPEAARGRGAKRGGQGREIPTIPGARQEVDRAVAHQDRGV